MITNHLPLLPILILLIGIFTTLLLRHKRPFLIALTTTTLALAASVWLLISVQQEGVIVWQSGGWAAPFGITLVADYLTAVFVFMVQIVMFTGVIYAIGSKDKVVGYPFFYPFFLALAIGLTGAMLTGDLFNLYVFAELLVISGTILTAVSDDNFGVEAAFKYFYISLLAAFFMLLAIGSLYAAYGTLNMAQLAQSVQADSNQPLLLPAIGFMLAFFMVKGAAFPFHFWQPDFHTAAPTAVSAMLSSVVVKLGVYGFLRMTTLLFVPHAEIIRAVLLAAGVVGVIYGGLAALATYNVKRMLAYSTLAQVGFVLVGIGWGTPLAIAAAIVFAFNHSLIKSAMLMLAGYIASRASVKSADFAIVQGVGRALPLAGILFFVGSLALAGIPPTNGFVSKALLFNSGIAAAGEGLIGYGAMALIGITAIFTLMYTTLAFMRIWWMAPNDDIYTKPTGDSLIAPLILVALILIVGIWADPMVDLAAKTAVQLGNPTIYIEAVLK